MTPKEVATILRQIADQLAQQGQPFSTIGMIRQMAKWVEQDERYKKGYEDGFDAAYKLRGNNEDNN